MWRIVDAMLEEGRVRVVCTCKAGADEVKESLFDDATRLQHRNMISLSYKPQTNPNKHQQIDTLPVGSSTLEIQSFQTFSCTLFQMSHANLPPPPPLSLSRQLSYNESDKRLLVRLLLLQPSVQSAQPSMMLWKGRDS